MSFASLQWLALGLAMDAAAVSAGRGLLVRQIGLRHVLSVALFFGGFQALMPLLGWLIGERVGSVVQTWDHWLAFVLLGALGGKMLWEARNDEPDAEPQTKGEAFGFKVMLLLAIATSVDAFAVGITLPVLQAPLLLSLVTIGVTTALLSVLALFAGRRLGASLGRRLDVVGGLVLIALGTKILIEHLSA